MRRVWLWPLWSTQRLTCNHNHSPEAGANSHEKESEVTFVWLPYLPRPDSLRSMLSCRLHHRKLVEIHTQSLFLPVKKYRYTNHNANKASSSSTPEAGGPSVLFPNPTSRLVSSPPIAACLRRKAGAKPGRIWQAIKLLKR